jgi:NAD(P)-dependent dehydrogenase (short-subunit alcohol dehydrogenase family)
MVETQQREPQTQPSPGQQAQMTPMPIEIRPDYKGSDKLRGKVAVITGGDSGIGRSVALHFAREGADIVIAYLKEDADAEETRRKVEQAGRKCLTIAGDIGEEAFCQQVVEQTVEAFGRLDILVNNAAEQHPQDSIEKISAEQLERTFRTNIFSMFFMTKAASPHLAPGACIINTTSVTNYKGSGGLLDYSSTKGAITAFTRSLSDSLVDRGIRVNGVAPGPIWTPLIPSTFSPEEVATFGADTPMKRAGQPSEVAPCFVFLASEDSSYMSGQVLHPNGGTIVNS